MILFWFGACRQLGKIKHIWNVFDVLSLFCWEIRLYLELFKTWKVYARVIKQNKTNERIQKSFICKRFSNFHLINEVFSLFLRKYTQMLFSICIMKIKSRQILTANHHCNILQCIIYSHRRQKWKKNIHNKKRIP